MSFLNDLTEGVTSFVDETWDLVKQGVAAVGDAFSTEGGVASLANNWNMATGADKFDQTLSDSGDITNLLSEPIGSGSGDIPLIMMAAQNDPIPTDGALDTSFLDTLNKGFNDQAKDAAGSEPTWRGGIGSTALKVGGSLVSGYAQNKVAEERARQAHKDRLKEIEVRANLNRPAVMPWR